MASTTSYHSVSQFRFGALRRHWYPIALTTAAVATFGLGLAGFVCQGRELSKSAPSASAPTTTSPAVPASKSAAPAAEPDNDPTLPLFKTFQLFLLNSGADSPSNGFLAAARVAAITLFLLVSGGVISSVTREMAWAPRRLLRRRHFVICGLGQIGAQLLDDFTSRGDTRSVVIIEPDESNPWVRHARAVGADVIHGDATRRDTLDEARAAMAATVYAVTGDDGTNLEIAAELENMVAAPRVGPQIRAHVLDVNLATSFQAHMPRMSRQCELHVFNVLRNSATSVIARKLWRFAPRTSREVSHFVILGFGPMGQTLAVQLAQLAHFPNRKRARFTIADHQIEPLARQFLARFPRFTAWSDKRLGVARFSTAADAWNAPQEAVPNELASNDSKAIEYVANAQFHELESDACDERLIHTLARELGAHGVKPAIFVCGQRDRENFSLAAQLKDRLECLGCVDAPIFVWLPRQPALAAVTEKGMIPFGTCQSTAGLLEIENPQREVLGQVIHNNYEQGEVAAGRQPTATRWEDLLEFMRESNRQAADHLVFKLAKLGYCLRPSEASEPDSRGAGEGGATLPTPAATPPIDDEQTRLLGEMEHNRWVAERLLAGWRYGAEKCRPQKQHPLLVPNEALSEDAKKLDWNQIECIPALVKAAREEGYILVRTQEVKRADR
jgi:voltage-gated potassium channel Kch